MGTSLADRTTGGLLGLAGGDALGATCEFMSAASAPIAPYSVNCLDPGAPGIE